MSQIIIDALKKLDPANPNHWTVTGEPRLDTVRMLASNQTLTREQIEAIAPDFRMSNAATWQPQTVVVPTAAPVIETQAQIASVATEPSKPLNLPEQATPEVELPAEEILAKVAEQDALVASLKLKREELNKELDAAIKAQDALKLKHEALFPTSHKENMNDIRSYLDAQAQKLAERGRKKKILIESGLDLKALQKEISGSPIDNAMARKSGFGTSRPV